MWVINTCLLQFKAEFPILNDPTSREGGREREHVCVD